MGVLWQAVQWTDSAAHRRSTATLEAAQAAHTPRACFNHHHLTCAAWLCSLGRRRRRQPARSPATPIGRALAPPTSFIFASLDGGWHGHGHEAWDGLDGLNAWMDWGGSGGRSDATPQTPRPLHSTSTLKHPLGSSWVLLGPLGSSWVLLILHSGAPKSLPLSLSPTPQSLSGLDNTAMLARLAPGGKDSRL
ncbi:hypothetical protein PCL_07607 [Purpureocillium lilacinum]|uniref:Uncharacterized protein n=1 Tax=Purpureocillium lilacinum TaxID=33203 RepID=A0A2U3EII3_PURLI|nr:hypothetical protein PCL_07607 [Purpureocillium lilacinum]